MFTKNVDFMLNHTEVGEIMCFLFFFLSLRILVCFVFNLVYFVCQFVGRSRRFRSRRIDTQEMMILGVLDGKTWEWELVSAYSGL